MKTPTKEKLAEKLASSIYEDIASTAVQGAREGDRRCSAACASRPTMTLDLDGSLSFSFQAGHGPRTSTPRSSSCSSCPPALGADREAASRSCSTSSRRSSSIDRNLLPLMRSLFQEQPEVAHVYLGSKRHMMEQIFNDENEPFWRSAKQMELGVIPPAVSRTSSATASTHRPLDRRDRDRRVLEHPRPPVRHPGARLRPLGGHRSGHDGDRRAARRSTGRVLRSENAHFRRIWEDAPKAQRLTLEALARDPGQPPLSIAYRREHNLPGHLDDPAALEALVEDELIQRHQAGYRIAEPFLAEWILRNDV